MSTSSPTIAAMRMGVSALERKRDFDEAVMNLRRARDEAQRQETIRAALRDEALKGAAEEA